MIVSPETLAREAAEHPPSKHTPKGIDWDAVADLGKVSDGVIAERLNVDRTAVRHARLTRFIPPVQGRGRPKWKPPFAGAVVSMTPVAPLADLPDLVRETGVLAAIADLSPDARERVLSYAAKKWPVST